jgi:uncharacterized protein YvpB
MSMFVRSSSLVCLALALGAAACTADVDDETEKAEASESAIGVAVALDVPWISQKPELPRGCEVTSLAMLLRHAGVNANKMTLAQQIKKVPYLQNGLQGDPYEGFVGNMYTFAEKGYGVYHGPVKALAEQYLPGRIADLTGASFDDLLTEHVARKRPVWVVTNATFKQLDAGQFQTWQTKSGTARITWHEHSVVVTGFDDTTVSINDPLDANGKNKKLARKAFRQAWEQMGRQALTYLPPVAASEPALPAQTLAACSALRVPAAPAAATRPPRQLAPFDLTASHAIAWSEARPGDAINRNVATPSGQQVALFVGWADAARSAACVVPAGTNGPVRAYAKATLEQLTPLRFVSSPGGWRSSEIGADCSVHADGRLYCSNTGGAIMRATPSTTAPEVNRLLTTYSWFDCWGTGEARPDGNSTWYHTQGDENPSKGWVAAIDMKTTTSFDANPSAHGLRKCAP